MLTTTHTLEGLEEIIKEWRCFSNERVYLNILPDILKSDIGGVLDHELPNKEQISFGIMEINYASKQLRLMATYSECPEVKAVKVYKHLLNDIKELLESETIDNVWDSIHFWIDENLNEEKTSREYALKQHACFASLISVLKECFEISKKLNKKAREAINDN